MTSTFRSCILAAAALLAVLPLAASGQLKPKDPNLLTPSVPTLMEPAANPGLTEKQKTAIVAAQRWLELLDRNEFGKAWDECAPLFQSKVTREQWLEGLPKSRAPLGAMKSRTVEGTGTPASPKEQSNLELMQVGFITQFEKQPQVKEAVTLVMVNGTWRTVGYLVQ